MSLQYLEDNLSEEKKKVKIMQGAQCSHNHSAIIMGHFRILVKGQATGKLRCEDGFAFSSKNFVQNETPKFFQHQIYIWNLKHFNNQVLKDKHSQIVLWCCFQDNVIHATF